MSAAGLSRTAFYRHFDDRHTLLLAMLEQVSVGVRETGRTWKAGAGGAVEELRAGLTELAEAMREHGRLMQAIADSAAYDVEISAARDEMVRYFVAVTADRIRADVAAGASGVRSPEKVAEALVRMNESVLLDAFGRPPYPPLEDVVPTMCEVWAVTIYGRDALDAADRSDQRST